MSVWHIWVSSREKVFPCIKNNLHLKTDHTNLQNLKFVSGSGIREGKETKRNVTVKVSLDEHSSYRCKLSTFVL